MPYKATNTKKFLDSRGLTYFSQQLNNYPDNTVIEAVVEGVQDALDEKLDAAQKGAVNGVAPLDATQKVPLANLSVMTGATNSAAGTSGLVPSSNAGDQNKFLKASGEWGIPAGTSIHQFVLDDMTNATGSYSHSTSLSAARATMKAVNIECSNPDAFLDAITITINNGSILLECNKVNGSSSILVTAVEGQTGEQLNVSQYAELVGKIGDIASLTTANKDSLTAAVNEIDSAQNTISSQVTNKIDKPVNVPEGKFLQTDSNGNAVWGAAASSTDVTNAVTDWLDDNIPTGQTVAVDQSLTVSGAAADAKKTGDKITDLKAAINDNIENANNGLASFNSDLYVRGHIENGADGTYYQNRIRLATIQNTGNKIWFFSTRSGYSVAFSFYDENGTYLYSSSWVKEYVLDANTYYRLQVRHDGDTEADHNTPADIALFSRQLVFRNSTAEKIVKVGRGNISFSLLDVPMEMGMITNGQDDESAYNKTRKMRTIGYIFANKGDIIQLENSSLRYIVFSYDLGKKYLMSSGWLTSSYEIGEDCYVRLQFGTTGDGELQEKDKATFRSSITVNSNVPSIIEKHALSMADNESNIDSIEKTIGLKHTIKKDDIENGSWANGVKINDAKRIRYSQKIQTNAGDIFNLINSDLYYDVVVYETESSANVLEESGFIKGEWVSTAEGYTVILLGNGKTYGESTSITASAFGDAIIAIIMDNKGRGAIENIITIFDSKKLEIGSWENGVKTPTARRLRNPQKFKIAKGTITKLLYSNLYYQLVIYETKESTTPLSVFQWTNEPIKVDVDGYATVIIANGNSWSTSTDITRNDFENSFFVVARDAATQSGTGYSNGSPYYDKLEKYAKYVYGDYRVPEYVAPEDFENFLWFTDPHTMIGNYTYNESLRTGSCINFDKYIDELMFAYQSTPTDFVLCGGDWNDGGIPAEELFKLSRVIGRCNAVLSPFYNCVGNHDTNYQGRKDEESERESSRFTPQCIRDLWYRDYEKCYYTFNGKKTRFYVLDTQIENSSLEDEYILNELVWFADALTRDDSEHIALAMHIYYYTGTSIHELTDNIMKVACAYNARSTITVNDTEYDYSDATGKIEFAIAGHMHADFETSYEYEGVSIPVIGSINAGNATGVGNSYYGAEHCIFDLVHVNYDDRKINLVRVGALGNDRTVNLT